MSKKTAIITGGSSGIGEACIKQFHGAGYNVVGAGRDEARTLKAIEGFDNAGAWVGDLCDEGATQDLIDYAIEAFGQIDVLVNSAGIIYRATAEETTDEQWLKTMSINVTSVFTACRAAMPQLRLSKGNIINIASDWGLRGGRNAIAYCASKGAVVQITRAMALDHAREGVRVNAICPGDVETPMIMSSFQQMGDEIAEALKSHHAESPTGRMTQAIEVADLAVYLASDSARQITGAMMSIDGGSTI